jgi:hypothetical protein
MWVKRSQDVYLLILSWRFHQDIVKRASKRSEAPNVIEKSVKRDEVPLSLSSPSPLKERGIQG